MPLRQRRRFSGTATIVALLAMLTGLVMLTGCGGSSSSSPPGVATPQAAGSPTQPTGPPIDPQGSAGPSTAPAPRTAPAMPAAPPPAGRPKPTTKPPPAVSNLATRLRALPSNTKQVIVVHGPSYGTTTATLEAYQKTSGQWTPAFPPAAVRIGSGGFSDAKHEGDKTTPTGMFAIDATMYGIGPDPGVRYAYHRLVPYDYWNENSDSPGYNTFVHGPHPGGPSEALWTVNPQYTHFAVIRYNTPATPNRGSGIFLHETSGNATLGCVSMSRAELVRVLTWLDPSAAPRIVLAPDSALNRF